MEDNNPIETAIGEDSIDDVSPYKLKPEIIQCTNLSKEYEIGDFIVRALDSISFNIYRGELVVFQGPSGAGKSTLLSIISGLDDPSSGDVLIEWVKVSDMSEESMSIFRAGTIGFVFQNYNLISSLTAEENILFPMQLAEMEIPLQEERVQHLLGKVGLLERSEHLPFQLSAGEQQRIGIARALANDPTIILADEPTANLDKKSSTLIADLFDEMNKDGKTIIIASHDDNLIRLAHRVFSIDDGKIIEEQKLKDPPDPDSFSTPESYQQCPKCEMFLPVGIEKCGFCGATIIKEK